MVLVTKKPPATAGHTRGRFDPWVGLSPWRRKWQPTPVHCLRNLTDRGARWATIHGVAESPTQLKELNRHKATMGDEIA